MDQLTKILNDSYGYLTFYRVKMTDEAGIYAARIETLLGKDERFVMAVVPHHMAIKPHARLNELHWVSFQTRSLPTTYDIPKQPQFNADFPSIKLQVKERSEGKTRYYSPFPVEIELLHNLRRKTAYQFNDVITLSFALKTWDCLINRIDDLLSIL